MPVRPLLLHRMALVSFRLYDSEKFGQLARIFWANGLPPPLAKNFPYAYDWDNIDALSDCFNMTLTDILDKHAPLKTRIMINRPKIPWFNDDIKQLKRKRRRLEKKALKSDLPGNWNNYHKVRNQCSALLKSARVNYHSNLIYQYGGDSRKLFFVSRPCTQILSLFILATILNKFPLSVDKSVT